MQVTLDGPRAVHDRRRPHASGAGTFDRVVAGIDALVAAGVPVNLRVVADRENLDALPELMPGRVGAVAGLFFGIAFGVGGIGAALLGQIADRWRIELVYRVCSFLPAIGLLTALLPDIERRAVVTAPRAAGA